MRILHTSDWHVGKMLRGRSRLDEHRAVLGEIVGLARDRGVDLVLVTGDLFESAAPAPDAKALVWETLLALRNAGAAVVVVAGNHDHAAEFEALRPLFAAVDITLLGQVARPDTGGVLHHTTRAGEEAVVALLPFVSQRYLVKAEQLLALDAAAAAGFYAERVGNMIGALCSAFRRDTVNLVAAHCYVRGGRLGGGERDAQTVESYALTAQAFPVEAQYVALGHLHRTQSMSGPAPLWYSGSPIQVDFGEGDDEKQVLLVDVEAGTPARVEPVPLRSGWRLRTLEGTLEQLQAAAVAGDGAGDDVFLRVRVREAARSGLADEVRELLPNAVDVQIDRPAEEPARALGFEPGSGGESRSARDLFGGFLDSAGHARDERLLALFDQLHDEATAELAVGAEVAG